MHTFLIDNYTFRIVLVLQIDFHLNVVFECLDSMYLCHDVLVYSIVVIKCHDYRQYLSGIVRK